MEQAARRLTRSSRDRVFAGVCGGFAEYIGVDPVLVRVLYVALTFFSAGFGILLYLISWIIVPVGEENAPRAAKAPKSQVRRVSGILLIALGALSLLAVLLPWSLVHSGYPVIGPVLVILAGIIMLMWRKESDANEATYADVVDNEPASSFTPPKRLYRIESDRKIAGICAGLARYFNIDPTIVRVLWVLMVPFAGVVILIYLVLWLIIPLDIESVAPKSAIK